MTSHKASIAFDLLLTLNIETVENKLALLFKLSFLTDLLASYNN